MRKTLLLVFVHGFRGGDDTFGSFPRHLRSLVSRRLPDVRVLAQVYPQYETKGELADCVSRFRNWLQDLVIDLEVQSESTSPIVSPAVHVVLVGHSMGGVVGADTILSMASDQPIRAPGAVAGARADQAGPGQLAPSSAGAQPPVEPVLMFPRVQGLLAFDTPFLGIAPTTVSHTAESQYRSIATAAGALSQVAGVLGWRAAAANGSDVSSSTGRGNGGNGSTERTSRGGATGRENSSDDKSQSEPAPTDAQAGDVDVPFWQRYRKAAMYAGAAGALAAGGAAAIYANRDKVLEGWSWATGHLEFVNCLAKPELLQARCAALAKVQRERGIGATNFYTLLGRGATLAAAGGGGGTADKTGQSAQAVVVSDRSQQPKQPRKRTFCNLPSELKRDEAGVSASSSDAPGMAIRWIPALNDRAGDEIKAHTAMFSESGNPRFHQLADEAVDQIVRWVDVEWYRSSEAGVATARRAVANQARPRGQAQSRSRSSAATKG